MRARMRANSFVSDFPRYRGRIGKSCAAVRRWNRDHVCGGKTRMPVFGDRRRRSIWKACTRPLGRQLRTETCFQSSRSSLGKARLRLRNPGIPTDPPLAASYCCTCRCTCLPASVHPLAMHNSDTILSLFISSDSTGRILLQRFDEARFDLSLEFLMIFFLIDIKLIVQWL